MFFCDCQKDVVIFQEKVIRLNKRLYELKQASRTWHAHLTTCRKRLGFEQCMTDVCVFRLIENKRVAITAVVHVDDMFGVGQKERWVGYALT